ncbi:MAG: transglycosylase SLT domain-containing protein [Chloroflexi bacterium]|nr:transglycosylase SLT domain-containing protein [Chloroflexota bacterium]
MPPEILDAASRALTAVRSRRVAFGVLFATAAGAVSAGEILSRKRTRNFRDKNKKKNKSKNKKKDRSRNKDASDGGCTVRHSEQEILDFIGHAAKKFGQSENAMIRVARCESALDPCAVNRSGPYYGLFQFLKSTWNTTPYGDRDIYDPEAQALATAWMWKEGRKNEWACQ